MDTTSYWIDSAPLPRFPQPTRDLRVDVVVIGGGITGITAAYLLKRAGLTVALLERERFARVDTGNTTAHLTCVTDARLKHLISIFGAEAARAVWDAGGAAIDQIFELIRAEEIRADFQWVPGYLHAPLAAAGATAARDLKAEAAAAVRLGIEAEYFSAIPGLEVPGVKFWHQALFHPRKYLAGLLRRIPGRGSHVFEQSPAEAILERPLAVKTGGHRIRGRYLVIATHTPLMGNTGMAAALLLQTKLSLYTSYALGARLPVGTLPIASFWDTADPYTYLRVEHRRGHDYAIFGGEDHKTGQEPDTGSRYRRLEEKFRLVGPRGHDYAIFGGEDHKTGQGPDTGSRYRRLEEKFRLVAPRGQIDHRWSGQVITTNDGLPLIGETAPHQFVATGYAGNGMTFGTLGAMMAVDAVLRRKNPWQKLFDVHRKKVFGGTWNYLRENKDYPYYLVRDRLAKAEAKSVQAVRPGEGRILNLEGKKVAAYRAPNGKMTLCSPVCTHLKGIVGWNDAEGTWDCPCHGARFKPTGEVLAGPAEDPLEKMTVPESAGR